MSTQNIAKPLTGRTAVITGASSGLGEATAELLAERGAKVALLARRADRLDELVERIAKNGGRALAVQVDVTDAAAVNAAADRVAAEFGDADLLFNNAGVMLPSPVTELRADLWQKQIDVNITGLMNAIGAFTPQLVRSAKEKGVSDLINTSSIAATGVFPNFAVYTGSKAFVSHATRNLRAELAPQGVRVSAIEPGIVRSELQSHVTDPGANAWLDDAISSMEILESVDVAEAVGFLAGQPTRVNFPQLVIMPTAQV
ncbi:SDR family oxidoreductase [Glycomyces buryatensis]|uniref:SDR family oxidoreductase n=1 Tax=Glycomyces buryatensis TaxID=2570927 RepID=A0A4S8QHP4_9ACTN|nr:SDR family oxidoreductase [Glycomyces buryatensis]THV42762.1 SDR family oxidoreductase [Glycomyces buryatensis]